MYPRTDREELVARMARNGIPARALADTLAKWVSMILSSSNSAQVEEAMSSLRWIKALEEAEVEAHERGAGKNRPGDIRDLRGRISKDLSEPIFWTVRCSTARPAPPSAA